MDTELPLYPMNGSDGASSLSPERETLANGGSVAQNNSEATERDVFLDAQQVPASNGERTLHTAEAQSSLGNERTSRENTTISRIKRELNEVAFWRVRVWMIVVILVCLIIAVIIISLSVCSAIHDDPDEKFDSSLFKFPLYFNGSFQLHNTALKEEHVISETLTVHLKEQVTNIYRSSPALGRYFSKAEISVLRNSTVIADYHLTFLMPEEQQDQLRKFILSKQMVYNVFRQFLYDQEPPTFGSLYIDPLSLNMV